LDRNFLLTGFALVVALLAGNSVSAQPAPNKDPKIRPAMSGREPDSGVHQMVILQGPNRSVHYFALSGSPAEQAALHKLEQAENELAYTDSLQGLKRQYVATESQIEARRRAVQMRLYGLNMDSKNITGTIYSGVGLGQPSPFGTPYLTQGLLFNGGFNNGFNGGISSMTGAGNLPFGGADSYIRTENTINQSLANGIGDEGKFKTAMVAEMARQASPEYSSTAARQYDMALTNAIGIRASQPPIAAASFEKMSPQRVQVTTKSNEKISGLLIREDNNWVIIRTDDSEERIRTEDIVRMRTEIKK